MDFSRKNYTYGPSIDAQIKDLSNDGKKNHVGCGKMWKFHNFKKHSKTQISHSPGYEKIWKKMKKIFFAPN